MCIALTSNGQPQRQRNLAHMGVPHGNYSGITRVNDSLYAVVCDKDETYAFRFLHLHINTASGKITGTGWTTPPDTCNIARRDPEAIAYCPRRNTFFIAGEADQRIVEYSFDGTPTGNELHVPAEFSTINIEGNRGFESLTYNSLSQQFWTTTESPLKQDKAHLRLQRFGLDLKPQAQTTYTTDEPQRKRRSRMFVHGVTDLVAMDDGSLVVMEREALLAPHYLGSYCTIKLYKATPHDDAPCTKTLICSFTTKLKLGRMNFANYEGMCLGPRLDDGRQTLILISDSQGGMGNRLYRAKDYIRLVILD